MVSKELLFNFFLTLSMVALVSFFQFNISLKIRSNFLKQLLLGFLFGIIVFIAMSFPQILEKGLIFDSRSTIISLSTYFFGLIPGIITTLIALIYRLIIGGPGIFMGSMVILSAFLLGLIFNLINRKYSTKSRTLEVILLSLFVHIVMFSLIRTLPATYSQKVLNELGFSILVVYPLISILVGRLLYEQLLQVKNANLLKENEKLWRTTLYSIGDAVITTDSQGKIVVMNKIAEDLTGFEESETIGKNISEVFRIKSEKDGQEIENPVKKVLSGEKIIKLQNHTLLMARDNKIYPIADSASAIIDENDKLLGTVLVFRDQTKEKEYIKSIENTNKYIKAEKNRYENLVNMLFAGLMVLSDNKITYSNKLALDLLGVSDLNELNILGLQSFMSEEDFMKITKVMEEMNEIKEQKSIEIKLESKSGKIHYTLFVIGLIDTHLVRDFHILIIDITEIKKLREIQEFELRIAKDLIQNQKLEELLKSIQLEILDLFDIKNIFIALYDKDTDLLYSPVEIDEKEVGPEKWSVRGSLTGMVVKQNRVIHLKREEIQDLIDSGRITQIGQLPECWLGVPLTFNNEVLGSIVIQDYNDPNAITQDVKNLIEYIANQISIFINKKLYLSKLEMMSKIVEEGQISIMITSPNGRIEYVNKKCCELHGYKKEELIGKNPRIFKSGFHDKSFYKELWDTILGGNIWIGEIVNKKKNGDLIWFKGIIMPIFDDYGKITHYVSLGEDITELKNLIENLTLEKTRAEEALRVMNNFLYNVSHEIRTPLNPILGYSNLVLETYEDLIDKEHKSWFDAIQRNIKRMTDTTTKILDIAKIDQQKYPLRIEKIEVNRVIEDVVNRLEILATEKNIYVKLNLSQQNPVIKLDKYGFETIISNLISNAIKFTRKGGVTINSFIEKDLLKIEVIDTGIGISEYYKNSLFTPFSQEDMGIKREFEGIGLGLALTKKFVDLLGGEIEVESEKDKGTKFTVIFKLQEE